MIHRIYKRGDKPYSVVVTAASTVTVTHNLGYKVNPWFEDASGYVYDSTNFSVKHNSVNEFEVDFGEVVTMTIYY